MKETNEIIEVKVEEHNSNLCEMLKFKNKDIKLEVEPETEEKTFFITVSDKQIRKKVTLIRDSELTRIIKTLNLDNWNHRADENGKNGDYPFIKDLIAVNVSTQEYKKNDKAVITVIFKKIVDSKIILEEVKFKRLMASTSNIRNKKIIYIKEELYDKANEILLCGMPVDMEHKQFSKYSAYYALPSTDSTPVTMPSIAVVNDLKNDITGICDLVKEEFTKGEQRFYKNTTKPMINKKTGKPRFKKDTIIYSVENGVEYTVKGNKPFDGAGLVDISLAIIWAEELGLDYIPSAFQFRAIAGIKGNLYVFDFKKFAYEFIELVSKDENGNVVINDAWENVKKLFNDDGSIAINVILTKSQYKFFDYLDFDNWKKEFETERHGYKRTFNISKVSDSFSHIKDKVLLSYQPLQSLNLNLEEIKELCSDTVETIKKISTNVDEFLKYRGLLDYEEDNVGKKKKKLSIPPYYKALKKNKDLFKDKYIQGKVQEDIKKFKENTYKGAILVPGNYQTLMPDIFALAQWAFGIEPKGLLKGNQVYNRYWLGRKVKEIDIIRFPHIANEHSIGEVVNVDKKYSEYYKYVTEGLVTAIDSFIPLKSNGADFDGDHILTTSSKVLIDAYNKQTSNTIVYIPDEKKSKTENIAFQINNMKKNIDTDIKGMSNSIGRVVNQITKLWSLPQVENTSKYIKIMSIIGSLTIDFVKTGEKAAIPKEINGFLNDIKKPDFMRVIYPKQVKREKDINQNKRINKKEEITLFSNSDCTMNRIYEHMKKELAKIELEKDKSEFDYKVLMNNIKPNTAGNNTYPLILESLLKLKKEYAEIVKENSMEDDNGEYNDEAKQDHEFKYRIFNSYARKTLLALCTPKNKMDMDKLLDYLVFAHYCDKTIQKQKDKNIIWNCFGGEFNKRLKDGVNVEFKKVDNVLYEKSANKISGKYIHNFKSEKKRVKIQALRPKENEESKEVTIFENELDYIKGKLKEPEERRLAFVLLSINKFCKEYNVNFQVYSGKKNCITKSNILELAGVHGREYEPIMAKLVESEVIKFEQIMETSASACDIIPVFEESEVAIKLTDLNQCRKYFKKLA